LSRLSDKLRAAVDEVRRDFATEGQTPSFDFQTTAVFVISTVLLTVFYYYGKSDFYRASIARRFEPRFGAYFGEWVDMLPYIYWGATSLVLRVGVPALVIWLVFRDRPSEWGFRVRGQWRKLPIYAGLYVIMLPFLYWAASQGAFQARYPFYAPAAEGGLVFWVYEVVYGLQFVGVEAFFRGFMIFGLSKKFGYYSLLIMAIPYVMIHFNKPVSETLGALVAGFVLGYLALKSKSFVNGILLHFGIALTMDSLAIALADPG